MNLVFKTNLADVLFSKYQLNIFLVKGGEQLAALIRKVDHKLFGSGSREEQLLSACDSVLPTIRTYKIYET